MTFLKIAEGVTPTVPATVSNASRTQERTAKRVRVGARDAHRTASETLALHFK